MNERLSICITTFQRADVLDDILSRLMPLAFAHLIPVYVNDNCSTDCTRDVLNAYSERYTNFFPEINPVNLGFDKNFEICLKRSRSAYVWGMADYSFVTDDAFQILLELCSSDNYDFIFLNNSDRVTYQVRDEMDNIDDFIHSIAWHVTLLDTIVWSRRAINYGNFSRYYGSLFGYYGTLLDYLSNNVFCVKWVARSLVSGSHPLKQSLWRPYTVQTWCVKWANMIFSLPYSISLADKISIIRSHNDKSKLFNIKYLLSLRRYNYLNILLVIKYLYAISISLSAVKFINVLISCLVPVQIARLLGWIYSKK